MIDAVLDKINKIVPLKWRWVLEHGGFRKYFKNTGWMFFGQMFSLVVSFFIGAWIARYLGPSNYGVLSYAIAFVGLFGFISTGADGILSRELVRFPEKRDDLLGTVFRLKIIGGSIAFLMATMGAIVFQTDPLIKLLIILFAFSFILQALNIISIYFQSEVKSKNNVRVQVVAAIISSLLKIALILTGQGVIWIVVIFVLESLWQGFGYLIAYKRYGLKLKNWNFDKSLARRILKYSWPIMLSSAVSFIYLKIDQVMIGAMLGTLEVGLYAAAVKLVEIWYFVPGIICTSLFPAIINAKKTNALVYKKRLKALYLLMGLTAFIIAIISTFLAPWIINLLFGKEYLAAVSILQIYVWSGVGLFIGYAIIQYFLSENRSRDIFFYNLLPMVSNVLLNLILIPRLGLTGAAWATLISYSSGPIVMAVAWRYKKFGKNVSINQ